MNGQDSSNQMNEFNNGSVLGSIAQPQVVHQPVAPVVEQQTVVNTPETMPSGNVQPPVAPVTPVQEAAPIVNQPVESVVKQPSVTQQVNQSTTPVAQAIPGTEGIIATSGSGTNVANSQNAAFMNQQKTSNIGTVPPTKDNQKKPMNKIVFIALIVALILGIAYGVYYFLTISKKKVVLNVKNVQLVSNVDIPTNVSFYANIVSGDSSTCKVDVTNVNSSVLGTYDVIIICGENTYTSKVTIIDNTPPDVLTNIIIKPVNNSIEVSEFINTCVDNNNSECASSFVNEESVQNNLQTVGGPYEVDINTSDSSNNVTNSKGILYITSIEPYLYTKCSSQEIEQTIDNYKVSKVTEDFFVFGNDAEEGFNYVFLDVARRIYKYTFETKEDYEKATMDRGSNITFDEITGHASYDDDKQQLTVSIDLPISTLRSENDGTFPSILKEIRTLYETEEKGYQCKNTKYTATINE